MCTVLIIFSRIVQKDFSVCKAEEGVNAVASSTDDTTIASDRSNRNSGKLFYEIRSVQYTWLLAYNCSYRRPKRKIMRAKYQKCMQSVKMYVKEALSHKWKLTIGIILSTVLFVISTHYLFEGIGKLFIVYSVLCLMTGAFFFLPKLKKWYFVFPVVILYLITVPFKMFQRIELPNHDLSILRDGAQLANALIILLVFSVFLLLFQRTGFAFAAGSLFLLLLMLVNYYCNLFRGSGLSFIDLRAVGTAMSVLSNYRLTMNGKLWYSILYFCFFISLGLWCDLPLKGKKYHIAVTAISLSYCLFFWYFWDVSDYLETHGLQGYYWIASYNEKLNGFLLSFGLSADEMGMDKPRGYSETALLDVAQSSRESYEEPCLEMRRPNIIFIMNEAWSDLRVLGELETTEDFMPYVDSLSGSVLKGNTYVKVLGGTTANSEFEALTGDSLTFLSPAAVPYSLQVNHEMHSLARVLKEQGYQTLAMHPSGSAAWNRGIVYEYFGFDDFIDAGKFQTPYLYVREFLSDECNFNEIIWYFEHKEEGSPLFLFDVTIQNHGDYNGDIETPISILTMGQMTAEEAGDVYNAETYLNLIKITDDAFADLVSYFETVDEPVMICMFGDHQPNLGDTFYNAMFAGSGLTEEEQTELKYITPYVIWANYDVEFPEYGDMSTNYLGAAVLECAGADLPPYYQYLLQIQKQYPVMSYQTLQEHGDDEAIIQYQMLQYNHLIERDYLKELFSVLP